MWYLINCDDGVIDKAPTKKSLLLRSELVSASVSHHRLGKPVHHASWDTSDGIGRDAYIYSSKEQAKEDGFDWAFSQDYMRYI